MNCEDCGFKDIKFSDTEDLAEAFDFQFVCTNEKSPKYLYIVEDWDSCIEENEK